MYSCKTQQYIYIGNGALILSCKKIIQFVTDLVSGLIIIVDMTVYRLYSTSFQPYNLECLY